MYRSFVNAVASACVVFAVPATAGSFNKPAAQVNVRYADLNLASAADARVLERRIHAAAVQVCGPVSYPLGVNGSNFERAREQNADCIANAEARARQHVAALQARPATQTALAGH